MQVWKLSDPSRRTVPVVVSYNPECDPLVHCQQTGTASSADGCREQSSTEMESHDTMTEMLGQCVYAGRQL